MDSLRESSGVTEAKILTKVTLNENLQNPECKVNPITIGYQIIYFGT